MTRSKSALRFYIASGLFSATRMGIGATSVVFMLSQGMSLSDIALVKIIQGLVIFVAEVPTGLVADVFGRKVSLIAAAICAILNFVFYLSGSSIWYFGIAEVFNALAISFWSGAFEALVVDSFKKEMYKDTFLEVLFTRANTIDCFATMLGGLLGGLLGKMNPQYPFLFSIGLGILTAISIKTLIKEKRLSLVKTSAAKMSSRWRKLREKLSENIRVSFEEGLLNPNLRLFFGVQILIQFIYQPVFHYWQPYFQKISPLISEAELGSIFFGYVGTQLLFSFAASRMLERKLISVQTVLAAELMIMVLSFSLMSSIYNYGLPIVAFILMQGAGGSFRSLIGVGFNRFIPSEQRATILSSVSFVSRVGMIVSLLAAQFLLRHISIEKLYWVSGAGTLVLAEVYRRWSIKCEGLLTQDKSLLPNDRVSDK